MTVLLQVGAIAPQLLARGHILRGRDGRGGLGKRLMILRLFPIDDQGAALSVAHANGQQPAGVTGRQLCRGFGG